VRGVVGGGGVGASWVGPRSANEFAAGGRRIHSLKGATEWFPAALLVGITLIFDFARFGAVSGGHGVAAALIVLSVVVVGLAVNGGRGRDEGVMVGEPPSTSATRVTSPLAAWLVAGALLAGYAAVHVALLRAGTEGEAAAVRAVVWTLSWYGAALLGILAAWARLGAGGWPGRREAIGGALAVGIAGAVAVLTNGAPVVADAQYKEGRLGWQAGVSDLRGRRESGKAQSFLRRASDRYALARRLAPWEPAYALAMARAAVEGGDVLDERLSRALAESGTADVAGEYGAELPDRLAKLVRDRDDRFAAALPEIAAAERLGGSAPIAPLTRARALRVWGDRTRDPERRAARLAEARAAYDQAIRHAPRWPEVLDEAAATAILAGDPGAALGLTERAIALDPFFARAWRTAASAHAGLGDPVAAAEAYARYFKDYRNTSDLPALRPYLEALVGAAKPSEALAIARDIAHLAPGDAHAHADLAVLLQQAGDAHGALAEARLAARLDPLDPAIADLVRGMEARGR